MGPSEEGADVSSALGASNERAAGSSETEETHADGGEDVRVDVERALVHARRERRVEALREPFRDRELVRDDLELRIPLQALQITHGSVSSCTQGCEVGGRALSSLAEMRVVVGVSVRRPPEGAERDED